MYVSLTNTHLHALLGLHSEYSSNHSFPRPRCYLSLMPLHYWLPHLRKFWLIEREDQGVRNATSTVKPVSCTHSLLPHKKVLQYIVCDIVKGFCTTFLPQPLNFTSSTVIPIHLSLCACCPSSTTTSSPPSYVVFQV